MPESVVVDERYSAFGPPPSFANGGCAAGLFARFVEEHAQVRLHRPVPVARPLEVRSAADSAVVLDGKETVATVRPAEWSLEVPEAIGLAEAEAGHRNWPGWSHPHPAPWCFVCGPKRDEGDGLRVFAGPVPGRELVATPWVPAREAAGKHGKVRDEIAWGVLECPGAVAFWHPGDLPLAYRLAVTTHNSIQAERPHVVVAWLIEKKDRKHTTGSAIFTDDGALLAAGKVDWLLIE